MFKRIVVLSMMFIFILCGFVGIVTMENIAYAESASNNILIYNQYGDGWSSTPLNYGASGGNNMENGGCHIFTYAHAIQWLTGKKVPYSDRATLINELIKVCDIPWGPTSYNSTNPQSLYNSHIVNQYGAKAVGVPSGALAINDHFSAGGVIIANPGGHYHLAVGSTYADFDDDGTTELYVHIVDSSCQSTWWRTNQNLGATLYTYETHKPITGYSQTSNGSYIVGAQGSKWGGGEYWVPYSAFIKYRLDRAYLPGYGILYPVDIYENCTYRITQDTVLYRAPSDTAEVGSSVHKGEYVNSVGLVNRDGYYWVKLDNGEFIYSGVNTKGILSGDQYLEFVEDLSGGNSSIILPSEVFLQVGCNNLEGAISWNSSIKKVRVEIYEQNGYIVLQEAEESTSDTLTRSFNLAEIDTTQLFSQLPVGDYRVSIRVIYYSNLGSAAHDFIASSDFSVITPVLTEKITLDKSEVKIDATIVETIKLTASIVPDTATTPKVSWSNSNDQVVNMVSTDNTVEITAIGAGTSTITCTAADGSGVQASCTITVIKNEDDSDYEYCQTCWEWRPMYYGCEGNLHWTICEFCDTIDEYSYASHVGTCLNLRKCYLCGKETDNDISEIVHGNYIFTALGKVHGVYCGDCGAFLFYANHSTDDCSNKECICGVTVTNEYHIWHQDDSYEYYPDPDNQNQHYNPCDGCGEWFYSAHVNNEDAVGTVACSDCGAAYTVSCNHSETRYDINPSDSSEHISVCTLCGEIIAYSSESHNYIYQACSDDPMYHIGACPDCGYITNNVHQVNCWGEDALCDFCDAECQVGMYEMNHGYSLAKIDPTNPNLHILYCVYCETVFQREAHYRTCDQPTSDNSCSVCDAENVIDEKHYYWDYLTGDGNVCPDPYDDAQHMTWCLECSAFMGYSNHFAYYINNGVWYCVCGEPYTIEECDHPRNSQEIDWNNPDFFGYYEFHPDLNDSTLHYTFCYDCGTQITGEHVTACFDPNVCVFCGTSFTGSIAHNYKNGVCIYCGEKGIVESKLKLSEDSIALQINKNPTHTLTVAEMPNTVETDELIWVSSNPNVAAVQIGTVTALAEGTAVITCMTKDGLLSCSCSVTVSAWNILRLPAGLVRIDAESFMGIYANEVALPDGIVSIGSKAFADCKNLIRINMPDSLVSIAEDAFANCGDVVFICESDNAAASFAESHNISCEIGD